MNPMTILMILELLDTFAVLLASLPEAKARYDAVRAKVEQMVEEDRDPTPEELDELEAEAGVLSARLKAARDRARGVAPGG